MDTHDETPAGVEAKPAAAGSELAPRITRLGAAIVDVLIGLVITLPIMFVTGFIQRSMQQEVSMLETVMYNVSGIAIYLVLHGYLLATRGQSIGKMLLGARIVDYDSSEILPMAKLVGLRMLPVWIISMIPIVGCLALGIVPK